MNRDTLALALATLGAVMALLAALLVMQDRSRAAHLCADACRGSYMIQGQSCLCIADHAQPGLSVRRDP